jgi:hypothetical protein
MWCDKHKHDMTLHDIPYCKQLTWMFTCLQHVPFFGKKHDGRFFHNSSADPSPCFFNAAEVQILTAQRMSFLFALLRWCTGWGHSYTLQKYLWEIKLVVNQYMKTAGGAPRKKSHALVYYSILQYTILYTIISYTIYIRCLNWMIVFFLGGEGGHQRLRKTTWSVHLFWVFESARILPEACDSWIEGRPWRPQCLRTVITRLTF